MMSLKICLQEKMPPPPGFYTFRGTDDGRTGGGYRSSPGPPLIASAFGDTDGEFLDQIFFRPKNFSAERCVDDRRRRSLLF